MYFWLKSGIGELWDSSESCNQLHVYYVPVHSNKEFEYKIR